MNLKKLIPDGTLTAPVAVGTKGFKITLRFLGAKQIRRISRDSLETTVAADGTTSRKYSPELAEAAIAKSAVVGWEGLTAEAFLELVPTVDLEVLRAQLPEGGTIDFSPENAEVLMESSPVFNDAVNITCSSLEKIRAAAKESELKNSEASPAQSSPPASSGAPDAGI